MPLTVQLRFSQSNRVLIRCGSDVIAARELASYDKRTEKKEEKKGHNHPFNEKCGQHCPRNEHYKGPARKLSFLSRKKQ